MTWLMRSRKSSCASLTTQPTSPVSSATSGLPKCPCPALWSKADGELLHMHQAVVVVEVDLPEPHGWLLIERRGKPPILAVKNRQLSAETASALRALGLAA
jgi:hypothetical protein